MLVTCDAESDALALEELRRMGGVRLPGEWLDTGDAVQGSILLVETEEDFPNFSARVEQFGSIFIRHIVPVDYEIALLGTPDDLQTLIGLVPELTKQVQPNRRFSVQSRILGQGKLPYRKVVLNETLSTALESATDAVMDCRAPQQVVSLLCAPDRAYVGVSRTEQNRSAWPGGMHRFKREDDQISRAEFKLLEAMSIFAFEFPEKGRALDIGASPGGWTRVLASRGLQVDAVDPGDLDSRLRGNRKVTHIRKRIQEYVTGTKAFAAIVNDMKMDARDSIEIMLGFAGRLAPYGVAVMTLKMPRADNHASAARKTLDMLRVDLERLATVYNVVGARQLYHNRSEVTVVMRAKSHPAGSVSTA